MLMQWLFRRRPHCYISVEAIHYWCFQKFSIGTLLISWRLSITAALTIEGLIVVWKRWIGWKRVAFNGAQVLRELKLKNFR